MRPDLFLFPVSEEGETAPNHGYPTAVAIPDEEGRYVLLGVPAGCYRLKVRRSGLVDTEVEVEVTDNETTEVEVTMKGG